MTTESDFHKSRRMFAILNGNLEVAEPETPDSHAVWFGKEGWSGVETVTRGYVCPRRGHVSFYVGNDFRVTPDSEKEFFCSLT